MALDEGLVSVAGGNDELLFIAAPKVENGVLGSEGTIVQ